MIGIIIYIIRKLNNWWGKWNIRFNNYSPISATLASMALILGSLPLIFIPKLLNFSNFLMVIILVMLLLILFLMNKKGKFIALVVLFFLWGNWHGINVIDSINFLSVKDNKMDITIVSIPVDIKKNKLKVRIDKVNNHTVFPPLYAIWNTSESVCAGQQWRVKGKIKPLHASLNEGAFDQQRFYLANRIIGVLKSKKNRNVENELFNTTKNDTSLYGIN